MVELREAELDAIPIINLLLCDRAQNRTRSGLKAWNKLTVEF